MPDAGFDCIIAGGGHAGSEAAVALAKLGFSVLLVSGNLDRGDAVNQEYIKNYHGKVDIL